MSEPTLIDLRSPEGREAVAKAMRLLSARLGVGRAFPSGQELYNEVFRELELPRDHETLLLVAAQAEIAYLFLTWASVDDTLEEIRFSDLAKDPQSVLALLDRYFDEHIDPRAS